MIALVFIGLCGALGLLARKASNTLRRQTRLLQEHSAALAESYDALERSTLDAIESLNATVEAKDPYTAGHSARVRRLALALGNELCAVERRARRAAPRRALPRHRQDRHPGRNPAQARPPHRRRVRAHEEALGRGRAHRGQAQPASARSSRSSATTTSAGTGAATPTGSPAQDIPLAGRDRRARRRLGRHDHRAPLRAERWHPRKRLEEIRRGNGTQFVPAVAQAIFVSPSAIRPSWTSSRSTPSSSPRPARERQGMSRARAAVSEVFFLNGMVFVSWYSRLPSIQDRLDLGTGALGLALLGAPLGLLLAQPLTGSAGSDDRVAPPRDGRRRSCSPPGSCPAFAVDAPHACARTRSSIGAANGALDVSMNVEGLAVREGRGQAHLQLVPRRLLVWRARTARPIGGLAASRRSWSRCPTWRSWSRLAPPPRGVATSGPAARRGRPAAARPAVRAALAAARRARGDRLLRAARRGSGVRLERHLHAGARRAPRLGARPGGSGRVQPRHGLWAAVGRRGGGAGIGSVRVWAARGER